LELVNPLVALVLFGAADVAERYVSQVERLQGAAGLRRWLWKRWGRLVAVGGAVAVLMMLAAPWLSRAVWGEVQPALLGACAASVVCLALYQHLAATLRGLRAYGAAAGMEFFSALLLLVLSLAAAKTRNAGWLMVAYTLSVLLPLVLYGFLLQRHAAQLGSAAATMPPMAIAELPLVDTPARARFASWALVRLLLVMLFGFLSIWGVRVLAGRMTDVSVAQDGPVEAGQYAIPYRVAQLLGFVAVTLWASSYGIAARAWSHGQVRRAKAQMFRIGRLGMALLLLIAVAVLWGRGIFAWFLPAYAASINALLPGLLSLFIAYGLVAFLSTYADLREMPQRGAAMWGIAVAVQAAGIGVAWRIHFQVDPKSYVLLVTLAGLAAALLIAGPFVLWPMRFAATGVPLAVMLLASASLLTPDWVVDWIAGPVLLATVAFLWLSGLLIRPADRRAFWRR
jgi:hypothetical protein